MALIEALSSFVTLDKQLNSLNFISLMSMIVNIPEGLRRVRRVPGTKECSVSINVN